MVFGTSLDGKFCELKAGSGERVVDRENVAGLGLGTGVRQVYPPPEKGRESGN